MDKNPNKNLFIKYGLFLTAIILVASLIFFIELSIEGGFKSLVKIVLSAFDVDPTPQPGSDLGVCTGEVVWVNMCLAPLQPILNWSVTSGNQVSYAVQVDNNGWLPKSPPFAFPSPEVDTGEIVSGSNAYTVPAGILSFNTTYYWQIAVKDNFGSWSGWTEADSSFTTTKHTWPSVDFSWSPQNPSVGENVQFADETAVYGGAAKSSWSWTIADATFVEGTNSSSQNPIVQFTSEGPKGITLQVTDSDGYTCSGSGPGAVGIQIALPEWKEILPR